MQYSRFDKVFKNPDKPVPPYQKKDYPKLITVGRGQGVKRIRVHDENEEKAAIEQYGKAQLKPVSPVVGVPEFDKAVEAEVQRRTSEAAEAMQKQMTEMQDQMRAMAEKLSAKEAPAPEPAPKPVETKAPDTRPDPLKPMPAPPPPTANRR